MSPPERFCLINWIFSCYVVYYLSTWNELCLETLSTFEKKCVKIYYSFLVLSLQVHPAQ